MYTKGVKSSIMVHDRDSAISLFEVTKRFYTNMPDQIKPGPGRDNDRRLTFPALDSEYIISTAGNRNSGHGQTLHNALFSEVSRWENADDHASGILQTVSKAPGTEVWLESTANGVDNWFYSFWQEAVAGKNGYLPLFFGWHQFPEYQLESEAENLEPEDEDEESLVEHLSLTPSQMEWRRAKISELGGGEVGKFLFRVQYPSSPAEAFQISSNSYLSPVSVRQAMTPKQLTAYGAAVMGIDPAYMGKDKTAICVRRGRAVLELIELDRHNSLQVAHIAGKLLSKYGVRRIFIDVAYGTGIYDVMRDAGIPIEPVNFASGPLYSNEVGNRRAEMYKHMKEWLEDGPVSLPNDPNFETEMLATGFLRQKNRLFMQDKNEVKKKIKRSPDRVDALALTFAMPVLTDEAMTISGGGRTGVFEIEYD